MAEQLRTLANPAEELGLGPSIRMAAYNHLTPVSGDLIPSSGLQGHQAYRQAAHIHTFMKTLIHIKHKS